MKRIIVWAWYAIVMWGVIATVVETWNASMHVSAKVLITLWALLFVLGMVQSHYEQKLKALQSKLIEQSVDQLIHDLHQHG